LSAIRIEAVDPLLRRFVEATKEADAERELSGLIEQHALPLAKIIVARKLRSFSAERSGRAEESDREDVIADAMLTLVERLQTARSDPQAPPIRDFTNYSATVIHSACAHYIRLRHPERARLKNRIRYVFSTHRRLALWTSGDELTCGLTAWRDQASDREAARALPRLVERAGHQWATLGRVELAAAAFELAMAVGRAVEFDAFVDAVSAGVVEPRASHDSSIESTLVSRTPAYDISIDQNQFLGQVWREVASLPVPQRSALLLNLRDSNGGGLLWLLPVAGTATIRQIALVLEIPEIEFARLWREMPLDDAAIAGRLGCTRQQVINLRAAARKRLMNRLGESMSAPPRARGLRANPTRLSTSLKGSA
jgi:hypothetical protein